MSESFSWRSHLEPLCNLSEQTTASEAWETLDLENVAYASIEDYSLIDQAQLHDIKGNKSLKLKDYFSPAPPKISLAADWELLSLAQLMILQSAVEETGAPGVLIYDGNETLGVLSAKTLASALPIDTINVSLGGNAQVGYHIYACAQCGSKRIPAQGENIPPLCHESLAHGPMSLEQ